MDEDEEVVFQNSALYEHLKDLGYSDEDVSAETLQEAVDDKQDEQFPDDECDWNKPPGKPSFWRKLKNSVDKAFWDENWTDQLTQLHNKYADELTDGILESSVLEEEDGTYIESFFLSMQSYRPEGHDGETSIMGTMLMQLAILGVSLAYAAFRLMYLKSPDVTSRVYIWSIDVMAVLLTIAALTPTTVKSASAGHVVNKLKTFSLSSRRFIHRINESHKLMKKSVRLIQEMELVARGFTMINPLTPVVRLEKGGTSHRQCPQLRQLTFHTARDIMLTAKYAARKLLNSFPSHVEIEGVSSYLANQPLHMYGPCVTITGKRAGKKLRAATDDYGLAAIKAMVELCNIHLSEFLRVLAMSILTMAEEHDKNPSFKHQGSIIEKVTSKIECQVKPLNKLYTLHKCLSSPSNKKKPDRKLLRQSPTQALYIAVHSLSLHLQAAQQRICHVEEELEKIVDMQQSQGQSDGEPPDDLLTQLTSDLKVIHVDLSACQDCADESQSRVDKCTGKSTGSAPSGGRPSVSTQAESESEKQPKTAIPLFEMGDPVIEDQVFEAYTDDTEVETTHDDSDRLLSEEEREKKKLEKQEAIRVLKELRSVIAVRAVEREERERQAILRQYPGAKFTDPTAALRNQTRDDNGDGAMETKPTHENTTPSRKSDGFVDSGSCNFHEGEAQVEPKSWTYNPDPECVLGADKNCDRKSNPEAESWFSSGCSSDPEHVADPEDIPDPESDSGKDHIKERLASMGGPNFPFTSDIASMAAARSRQMAPLSVDTFGDESDEDSIKDDDDDDIVEDFVDISKFPTMEVNVDPDLIQTDEKSNS